MRLFTNLCLLVCITVCALPALADVAPDPESQIKQDLCRGHGRYSGRAVTERDYEWDILHTELHLTPDIPTEILESTVTFTVRSQVAGLTEIALDLAPAMIVQFATVFGETVTWNHTDNQVILPLDPPAAEGQELVISLSAVGTPSSTGMGSFSWTDHDGTPLIATLSEPEGSRDWWPCKDVPDDKFTADIFYRVPMEYSAPGPGLLQSVTVNGDGTHTWHWREIYPISTYLIALTVTNYLHYTDYYVTAEGDSLPIENYVYPENYDESVEDLSITPEAMELLVDRFGAYPFMAEKYGHMSFHWGGAMEHQTCTSFGGWLLTGGHHYDRIVVHELAHQWFGDAVTLQDWENVWLNEGFARYSEALWFEHRDGTEGYLDYMMQIRRAPIFEGPVYNNPVLFGTTVYSKGAWVVHMLRTLVDNDELFFAAIREYLGRHMYDNAHTTDLQSDLEEILEIDLTAFFQQWVYGANRPDYLWAWTKTGAPGNWQLQVCARQTQTNAGLFVTPLSLRIHTSAGELDWRVDNDSWTQLFVLPLGEEEPLDVEFDPDHDILRNETEMIWNPTPVDDAQPATPTAITGNWPNPFNPRTRIAFTLAAEGDARLAVYDTRGRQVRMLCNGPRAAGPHSLQWDGLDDRGGELPSGVYLARLAADGEVCTRRMTLMK
ncbi:MAG: hypothetical protein GY835_00790 [bacterium]|nr:hypothetical protein [bacterium]